jgi:hypothetical protein
MVDYKNWNYTLNGFLCSYQKKLVLKVTPFLLAFLFLSGMRDKWQAIAKE